MLLNNIFLALSLLFTPSVAFSGDNLSDVVEEARCKPKKTSQWSWGVDKLIKKRATYM